MSDGALVESDTPNEERGVLSSRWSKRVDKAEKFLRKAREHGHRVEDRYMDEREDALVGHKRANLFYSNVNTLKESLFNSLPKPAVTRLHAGAYEDDVSRVAAIIVSRGLEYEVRCAHSFTEAIRSAILDRLVPGYGTVWVRFEDPETIAVDPVYWRDFIYSPARNWHGVTWVGRRVGLTRAQFKAQYPDSDFEAEAGRPSDTYAYQTEADQELTKGLTYVYEIWDKDTRTVIHLGAVSKTVLRTVPDPYNLRDFFPCPKVLISAPPTKKLLPLTDYHIAQDQYTQLDVIYARMALIIEAIKVTGVYDASAPELGRMLQGHENKLIPVDNWAMFAEKGAVKGSIDWYPVETVAMVLKELQAQFEAIKSVLYEVTGMSDIIRGASQQYETAAAQQIKAQFAGVRLGGYQRDVAEFVRCIMRIIAEMMTQLYSPEKLMAIVGPLDPADEQYIPQALETLKDDVLSKYSVDIQADSLVQADWALEKEQRAELVNNLSTFIQSNIQLVQQDPAYSTFFFGMLKFAVAGYKGGQEIEGLLDQMIAASEQAEKEAQENPQPPPPSPEEMKMQLEQQKMQAEQAMEQQRFAMEQEKMQAEMAMAQQKMQMEMAQEQRMGQMRLQLEQAQAQADLAVQQQKAQLDAQLQQQEMEHKSRMFALELQMMQVEMEFKNRERQMEMAMTAVDRAETRADDKEDREIERVESEKDRVIERKAKAKEPKK
jgi:hypothetical protein